MYRLSYRICLMTILSFSLLGVVEAAAQDRGGQPAQDTPRGERGPARGERGPARGERGQGRGMPPGGERGGPPRGGRDADRGPGPKVAQLRNIVLNEYELTDAQHEKIEALFDEFLQNSRGARGARGGVDSEKMAELAEEMREAQEAGDRERANEIRQEIQGMLRSQNDARQQELGTMLEKVAKELDKEQQTMFWDAVERLRLNQPSESDMQKLIQAVMKPEIGLSDDQRDAIRELTREYFRAGARGGSPRDGGGRPEDQAAKYEEFKNKVYAELDASQKEKVEAALKEINERNAGRDRGRRPESRDARRAPAPQKPDDDDADEDEDEDEHR